MFPINPYGTPNAFGRLAHFATACSAPLQSPWQQNVRHMWRWSWPCSYMDVSAGTSRRGSGQSSGSSTTHVHARCAASLCGMCRPTISRRSVCCSCSSSETSRLTCIGVSCSGQVTSREWGRSACHGSFSRLGATRPARRGARDSLLGRASGRRYGTREWQSRLGWQRRKTERVGRRSSWPYPMKQKQNHHIQCSGIALEWQTTDQINLASSARDSAECALG